jgi:cell division protein FtsQ
VWEETAPADTRFRRERQSAPPPGRALPATPLDPSGADDDGSSFSAAGRLGARRFDRPRNPWWRPASTAGRVFLTLATLAVLGGFAASAYLLKTCLDRDSRFRLNEAGNIEATGLTEVSRVELLPVFGDDIGRSIFFVPLKDRRKQLEEIPWIERATVMRLLPDQIRVQVVERQPVAFVRQGQQIGLVDANGVLLAMPAAMMAQHHYSFPTLSGIDAHDPLAARKARMAVYQRLLAELDASGQKLSEQISEVNLTDPADARVIMEDDPGTLLHFGQDRFLERYQRYASHINEWRQKYPKLAAVDLRYDQQMVLEMAPGTNVAQATADEQPAVAAEQDKPSAAKPAGNASAKAKTAKAKDKAAKVKSAKIKASEKKRAEAKRAALNLSRQKTAPASRPAASAGMGQ